jgi:hypothetical protein
VSPHPSHDNVAQKWPEKRAETVDALHNQLERIDKEPGKVAWRGHARPEWELETTLDRCLKKTAPDESYEQWLGREHAVFFRFRQEAGAYASDIEANYLDEIWNTLAFGRHAGLPTRLLDWAGSPWVAAWFASHEHSDADGVVWWFNQTQLEQVIRTRWDEWGVPTRAQYQGLTDLSEAEQERVRLNERALEATAFNPNGHAWISKLHYQFPCARMEAQQGFATVCGRLRTTNNDAVDQLENSGSIQRGRIVIGKDIKGKVLDMLHTMNIHAASLKYPGVDIVARRISP